MPTPTLTFNPSLTVFLGTVYTVLDPAATVSDGGNTLGAIRITLGVGGGSLGVVSGGSFTTTGTIGNINYLYEATKRLLSLTSSTATGADFTQVLRLVAYNHGSGIIGTSQTICVNLGIPIYSLATGHYYEFSTNSLSWDAAKSAASSRAFLGLTGYLATVTSAAEGVFLFERFRTAGWVSGSFTGGVWSWSAGPEIGTVFWNGSSPGTAQSGQYANWGPGNPTEPVANGLYVYFGHQSGASFWNFYGSNGSYIEYSTDSGTGDDGLSGTRTIFTVTVGNTAEITALIQASNPVQVSLVNGAVTSTIGVALAAITIGPSNATHMQVSINLGTNNAGKRRQARGFRVIGGVERELIATRTQVGEIYNFVFLKTSVEGSTSVNLLLN